MPRESGFSLGITAPRVHATMALSNLAMLCGNLGKEAAGINPYGDKQCAGASDIRLPVITPAIRKFIIPKHGKFEQAWESVCRPKQV